MEKENALSLHSIRQDKRVACNDRPGRAGEKKEASDEAGLQEGAANLPTSRLGPEQASPGPNSYLLLNHRLSGAARARPDQLLRPALSSGLRHS